MKKKFNSLLVIALLLICTGCGGTLDATIKDANGKNVMDVNSSATRGGFNPPMRAHELGQLMIDKEIAQSIRKDSERVVQNGGKENNSSSGTAFPYRGIVINDDPAYPLWFSHPELNKKISVKRNGWAIVYTKEIHNELILCNQRGDCTPQKTYIKQGWYSGVNYDYGIRVYRVDR